jgi:D-amino-acid dehydrogenase
MRVIVIGAGITGLATAHFLLRDGHDVTVIDQQAGPALGASFANGAQLSYSYVAPLAGPGVLPKVPPWLLRRDAPLRFRPKLDTDQWRWLIAFVLACNKTTSDVTTRRLLALSFHSRALMQAYVDGPDGVGLDFGYARNGKLVVYSDAGEFAGASARVSYQRELGCEQEALDADACAKLEPALADPASGLGQRMVGAIYTASEEVGDCYRFCVGIQKRLAEAGVKFHFNERVVDLRFGAETGGRARVLTGHGSLQADAVVLASGTASPRLARGHGIYLPVHPLKGYSITVGASALAPRISVTDFKKKVVYAPLADMRQGVPPDRANAPPVRLRIAGMADLVGHNTAIDPERLNQLIYEARTAFPGASTSRYAREGMETWAGLRPATPRGTPILGATPVPGLFVNVGQGALGWTLALASGHVLADCIAGRKPAVPLDGMSLALPG